MRVIRKESVLFVSTLMAGLLLVSMVMTGPSVLGLFALVCLGLGPILRGGQVVPARIVKRHEAALRETRHHNFFATVGPRPDHEHQWEDVTLPDPERTLVNRICATPGCDAEQPALADAYVDGGPSARPVALPPAVPFTAAHTVCPTTRRQGGHECPSCFSDGYDEGFAEHLVVHHPEPLEERVHGLREEYQAKQQRLEANREILRKMSAQQERLKYIEARFTEDEISERMRSRRQ